VERTNPQPATDLSAEGGGLRAADGLAQRRCTASGGHARSLGVPTHANQALTVVNGPVEEIRQGLPQIGNGFANVIMQPKSAVVTCLAVATALASPVFGQSSLRERGQAIAQRHCARCHAIDDTSDSPMGLAPPFRDLSKRYAIGNLAEALAEGIVTGHPAMPRFTFEPREIDALLTFIGSLSPSEQRPSRNR